MRTNDFSAAPAIAHATVQFVTGIRFTNPWAFLRFLRYYRPVAQKMRESPGFLGQHIWYRPPLTMGMMVFFTDAESLMEIARCPEHVKGVQWLLKPSNARGSFSRIYDAHARGSVAGDWSTKKAT